MTAETARYRRITHRLAIGVASADDDASRALAEVLRRRIVESITAECAPLVTSDLLSERVAQAIAALGERGVALCLTDGGLSVEACFCGIEGCNHPAELLGRLLGASVEPITSEDGRPVLRVLGALDAASYTEKASTTVSKG